MKGRPILSILLSLVLALQYSSSSDAQLFKSKTPSNKRKIWPVLRKRMIGARITSLQLINSISDNKVIDLVNGTVAMTSSIRGMSSPSFSVLAQVNGTDVQSVKFVLLQRTNGAAILVSTTIENYAPYTLCGSRGRNIRQCKALSYGDFVLTVTPYAQNKARGEPGRSTTIHFAIVDATAAPMIATTPATMPAAAPVQPRGVTLAPAIATAPTKSPSAPPRAPTALPTIVMDDDGMEPTSEPFLTASPSVKRTSRRPATRAPTRSPILATLAPVLQAPTANTAPVPVASPSAPLAPMAPSVMSPVAAPLTMNAPLVAPHAPTLAAPSVVLTTKSPTAGVVAPTVKAPVIVAAPSSATSPKAAPTTIVVLPPAAKPQPTKAPVKAILTPTKAPIATAAPKSKAPVTKAPTTMMPVVTKAPVATTTTTAPILPPTFAPLPYLELINASAKRNKVVMRLNLFTVNVVNLKALGLSKQTRFNINAVRSGQAVKSVAFSNAKTETNLPWSYCGNEGLVFFACPDLLPSTTVNVTVTPYPEKYQVGKPFPLLWAVVQIVDGPVLAPVATKAPVAAPMAAKAPIKAPLAAPMAQVAPVSAPRVVVPPVAAPRVVVSPIASAPRTVVAPVSAPRAILPPAPAPRAMPVPPVSAPRAVASPVSAPRALVPPVSAPRAVLPPVSAPRAVLLPVSAPRVVLAPMAKKCTTPKLVGSWIARTPHFPVAEGQGAMIGTSFIIVGGFLAGYEKVSTQTHALDTTNPNAKWQRMDDYPFAQGVTHGAFVVVGTKFYICGGYAGGGIGKHTDICMVYDHSKPPGKGQQWTTFTKLPDGGRGGGGMVYDSTLNALIFSAGCTRATSTFRSGVDHADTWMYSLGKPSLGWVPKAPMPFFANHMSSVTAIDANGKERHYFSGGQNAEDEHDGNQAEHFEYDASKDVWIKRQFMTIPRGHAASSTRAIGCGFIMVAGCTNNGERIADISYYDVPTDSWTSIGNLSENMNTPVCDISNGALHCYTGWDSGDFAVKIGIAA